jgi:predicted PurR-regulated permease PerM
VAARRPPFSLNHPIIITFLILAVIGFLSLASEAIKPLALAVLLSFALAPLARFFERRGLPRGPAVVLTVLLALGALGVIGYQVGQQLTKLANDLPKYKENILKKAERLRPSAEGPIDKATRVASEVAQTLEQPIIPKEGLVNVNVVSQPTFQQRLLSAVGPYLELVGVGAFVLILVLFLLMNREDLGDRIIRLFGHSRVSLTTKTLEEVGQRISRYLAMLATVNSSVGLIVGLGLWAIGVPYAVLWGVLAALLRFIPYVGPATAFVLPLIFSIANFPTWREPLMVVALFVVLEISANTFLEPVIYGKTTGVSAFGLLVAALFWTWLWGVLGLLLSTPLTVCLAVLGKYVPALSFFATLLGEEAALEPDVRFYQRLLAIDQDGAAQIIETALNHRPRVEVFDRILIPTLSRVERDAARGDIDEWEKTFIWRYISDLLDDLAETPELDLKTLAPANQPVAAEPSGRVVGVAATDSADALVLKMLDVLLAASGCPIQVLTSAESPLKLAEQVGEAEPQIVVLSYLPPGGLTTARYLVRRLRARFADLPILVGRWGEAGDASTAAERLKSVGAWDVVFRLTDARDRILARVLPQVHPDEETGVPLPGLNLAAPTAAAAPA